MNDHVCSSRHPSKGCNQLNAKLSVSGPGAVQFTPASGALPESWSALTAVVHSPGGGDIVRNMDVMPDGNPVMAHSLTNEVGIVRIK